MAAGDVLCDVETDKATMAWENQDEGFVAKILLDAGAQNVPVGTAALVRHPRQCCRETCAESPFAQFHKCADAARWVHTTRCLGHKDYSASLHKRQTQHGSLTMRGKSCWASHDAGAGG